MKVLIQSFASICLFVLFFYSQDLSARIAAIVIDYDTKDVLFEINADTRNYPASLTKIMTLYILFDKLEKGKLTENTALYVSAEASSRSPSKLFLEEGSSIKVKDAVLALIIKSANDVATVVAEHISGTERNFAKLMNKYAKDLGMEKTTFKNASGLPNGAQMTTARDIVKLSHALIKNFPDQYKLFSKNKFIWKDKTYKTHNKLMLNYKGADGIKTGYIKASGFQLAFSAKRNEKRLIGVYFGGDTGKQRDNSLKIIMDKVFGELNLTKISEQENNSNKTVTSNTKNSYSIVVGTFKDKNNAEKQLKLIKKKYPKTTALKRASIVLVRNKNIKLYESRFEFFTKKEAYSACNRLKKYKRDCFVRL